MRSQGELRFGWRVDDRQGEVTPRRKFFHLQERGREPALSETEGVPPPHTYPSGSYRCPSTRSAGLGSSLRDCSFNFSKSAATSASCPTFAIQVTANTTIVFAPSR